MKKIILEITKRLIEKTIQINNDDFMAYVSIQFVGGNMLMVTLFDKDRDNRSYWFEDYYSDYKLKSEYKKVLKLINRRVIE